jgi:formylglycine-generating enzyme required for sulfatase activity
MKVGDDVTPTKRMVPTEYVTRAELTPQEADANTWHGRCSWKNLGGGGQAAGTSTIGRYPPNGFGLHGVTGSVWEWTNIG